MVLTSVLKEMVCSRQESRPYLQGVVLFHESWKCFVREVRFSEARNRAPSCSFMRPRGPMCVHSPHVAIFSPLGRIKVSYFSPHSGLYLSRLFTHNNNAGCTSARYKTAYDFYLRDTRLYSMYCLCF